MSSEKSGSPFLSPSPPPPLPPVRDGHPPAPRGRRPGFRCGHCSARPLIFSHSAATTTPRPARPGRRGAPTRLRHLAPHATRPLPAGDSLRGPAAPAAASRRRSAPAGALSYCPGSRLRGAHAHGCGRHAATGGLRSPRLPPTAAALHCLRAGLPGGHALRRRDPGGHRSDLHTPPAAPGPRAGPAGAKAPAARLHAHRGADHHLLLLAHGHHRHLQGRAGAHGLGPRRHGVCRDRITRGPELLLYLPGGGHRSHGALYHPHRSHHHCRAAPRELLGSVRTPRPGPTPCPSTSPARSAATPRTQQAPRTPVPGAARCRHILNSASTELLAWQARSESSSSGTPKKPTPRNTTPRHPRQTPGPQPLQSPAATSRSAPRRAPSASAPRREQGPQSSASSVGSAPAPTRPRLQVGRLRPFLVPAGARLTPLPFCPALGPSPGVATRPHALISS